MSDDDEQEIKLRDQFAMAAMQALVANYKPFDKYIENLEEGDFNPHIVKHNRTKRIATIAYIIADEMRLARLKAIE